MKPAPDRRRAELAKIHILAKQLGIDDDTYRDVLWSVARVDSARDLDEYGRGKMIEQLQSRVRVTERRPHEVPDKVTSCDREPAVERAPMLHKVHALLGDRGEAYALGILRHMFQQAAPERLEWATPTQLHKLIAALVYDAKRHKSPVPAETV